MKRILIVTELFYPDETSTSYILTRIANALSNKYEVLVICGSDSYSISERRNIDLFDLNKSIKIKRVCSVNLDKNKILSRLIRFIIISISLFFLLLKNLKKGDIILTVTNPAPLLLLISLIKTSRNSLYILVHDVFPENMIPAKIFSSSKSFIFRLIQKIFNKAYKKADLLIVLGRDMKDVMMAKLGKNEKNTRVEIVENWADTKHICVGCKSEPNFIENPKIDIQYAGNIGRVQGLTTLLEILKDVSNPELRFSFWGDGALKEEMKKKVIQNNINNVYFYPSYKREEQNRVLNNCDLAVVTLAEGMYGLGVPSKSYNIMAAGKPILFIGNINSEIALMIKDFEIGYCFDSKDVRGISNFFSHLTSSRISELKYMGKKARIIAETKYSEEVILKKFVDLL